MERLNFKECENCKDWNGCISNCFNICGKPLDALKEFKEFKDLEEQGRLLKLPCAVGDTVYYADNEYYFAVLPIKVDEICIMEPNVFLYKCLLFDGNGDVETQLDFNNDDIGKTVFFTKEEAMKAMREKETKEMDRLTIQYDEYFVPKDLCTIDRLGGADDCISCEEYCQASENDCDNCGIQKCFEKLAAYENTGLTPEQIKELQGK